MIEVSISDAEKGLKALLESVEKNGTWVRICRNGTPIADLRPASSSPNPLAQDERLSAVQFVEDPSRPLSPADWPEEAR